MSRACTLNFFRYFLNVSPYSTEANKDIEVKFTPIKIYTDAALLKQEIIRDNEGLSGVYR